MKPIEIYYCIDIITDACITLVEKDYWEENHYYDEYSAFCTITPHYNLNKDVTAESIITKMREKASQCS